MNAPTPSEQMMGQMVADLRQTLTKVADTVEAWPEKLEALLDKRQYVDMKTFNLSLELINKTIASEVAARQSADEMETNARVNADSTEATARKAIGTVVEKRGRRDAAVIAALGSAILVGVISFIVYLAEMGVHPK